MYERKGRTLINRDSSEYEKYLARKRVAQENQNIIAGQADKINTLERELQEIKNLLLQRAS